MERLLLVYQEEPSLRLHAVIRPSVIVIITMVTLIQTGSIIRVQSIQQHNPYQALPYSRHVTLRTAQHLQVEVSTFPYPVRILQLSVVCL